MINIEQQNVGRKKDEQDREFWKSGRGKNTSNTKAREQVKQKEENLERGQTGKFQGQNQQLRR